MPFCLASSYVLVSVGISVSGDGKLEHWFQFYTYDTLNTSRPTNREWLSMFDTTWGKYKFLLSGLLFLKYEDDQNNNKMDYFNLIAALDTHGHLLS